jgi:hypothetical protein
MSDDRIAVIRFNCKKKFANCEFEIHRADADYTSDTVTE